MNQFGTDAPIETAAERSRRKGQALLALRIHIWKESDLTIRQRARAGLATVRYADGVADQLLNTCDAMCAELGQPDRLIGGTWQDFLQWLWEHREEILEFILMLISLFAEKDPS